jgi:hypothetical protein
MVPTKELRRYAYSMKYHLPVSTSSGKHHTLYSRKDRDDLVMVLSCNEVRALRGSHYLV